LTLPFETDEQTRRRVLSACQDHARLVLDIARQVANMLDSYLKGDAGAVNKYLADILSMDKNVKELHSNTVITLVQTAPVVSRGDVIRLLTKLTAIADSLKGAAYRIESLASLENMIDDEIGKALSQLSTAVLETITELRKTLLTLSLNPQKAIESSKNVKTFEEVADGIYRETDFKVLKGGMDFPRILLVREILLFMENAADSAEDAVDDVQVLVFSV